MRKHTHIMKYGHWDTRLASQKPTATIRHSNYVERQRIAHCPSEVESLYPSPVREEHHEHLIGEEVSLSKQRKNT